MKVSAFRFAKGGMWGFRPEAEDLKKNRTNEGFFLEGEFFIVLFFQFSLNPQNYERAPQIHENITSAPSSLKINSQSPQIHKTPGGPHNYVKCLDVSFSCGIYIVVES